MAVALWLTRGAQHDLPGAAASTAAGSATRPRSSPRSRSATPSRRSTPPTSPSSAAARSSWRTFFDEELGPHIRQLAWHELSNDPESFAEVMAQTAPAPARQVRAAPPPPTPAPTPACASAPAAPRTAGALARKVARRARPARGRAGAATASTWSATAFSVADLTAASLFYPLVAARRRARCRPTRRRREGFERFRAPLEERRGFKWVEEMFRRHRKPAKATAAAAA